MHINDAAKGLETRYKYVLPRLLSQICRDPNDVNFGCCDRNFWHYRIRDFSSIILQQGAYFVFLASKRKDCSPEFRSFARTLSAGGAAFWNKRAKMRGAFEEYYPFESGYPPLAFSALAVAKLASENAVDPETILPGMRKAARQLSGRFEPQAANQQIAGLAALAWIAKVYPDLVEDGVLDRLKQKSLSLQTKEGWFWEYDGPDIGYLSVTIDCLWDLYDATQDRDYICAAEKALTFIYECVIPCKCGLGMINARNTDYIVPYGITRFLTDGTPSSRGKSLKIIEILYSNSAEPSHFFSSVDDRYWCHYIGHSLVRALEILDKCSGDFPAETCAACDADKYFDLSGYMFSSVPQGILTVAAKKGGAVRLLCDGCYALDFGWIVKQKGKQYVSHWWSQNWDVSDVSPDHSISISGCLFPHRTIQSSPLRHFILRLSSFIFGRHIIKLLKGIMIFKKNGSGKFVRKISFNENKIEISDFIYGFSGALIEPAGRTSKRHVASADSYHCEDSALVSGITLDRQTNWENGVFHAVTVMLYPEKVSEIDNAN